MKKTLTLIFGIVLILFGCGEKYADSGISDMESYSDYEEYSNNTIDLMYPENWIVKEKNDFGRNKHTIEITQHPKGSAVITLTLQKMDSVKIAESAVIAKHNEVEDI